MERAIFEIHVQRPALVSERMNLAAFTRCDSRPVWARWASMDVRVTLDFIGRKALAHRIRADLIRSPLPGCRNLVPDHALLFWLYFRWRCGLSL